MDQISSKKVIWGTKFFDQFEFGKKLSFNKLRIWYKIDSANQFYDESLILPIVIQPIFIALIGQISAFFLQKVYYPHFGNNDAMVLKDLF